jgi:pimeloyl-ACP methyl ester carboxylesterase
MVDVGGHRLHVRHFGDQGPVVTIEAAGPAAAFEWRNVIAPLTTACRVRLFERAGYGWSERGPEPRTSAQNARELRALVEAGAIETPFVLVGHSLGGVNARVYAATHPADVCGLVLVDSSHEDQLTALPDADRDLRRNLRVVSIARFMARTGLLRALVAIGRAPFSNSLRGLSAEDRRVAVAQVCDPWAYETLHAEISAAPLSLEQARALRRPFGDLPLAVLTRGRGRGSAPSEAAWRRLQEELATRSSAAVHVLAETSGHYVHEDQPDVVVAAIRRVAGVEDV